MKEFAEKLKELREEKGLSPEELSKKLEKANMYISPNSIRNYENGIFPKEVGTYNKLANFFNVTPNYLFDKNIENKSYENIEISKLINLSDKSINNLKEVTNNGVNYFIENIGIKDFSEYLEIYTKIQKFIEDFSVFSDLLLIPNYLIPEEIIKLKKNLKKYESIYKNIMEIIKLHEPFSNTIDLTEFNEIYKNLTNLIINDMNTDIVDIDIVGTVLSFVKPSIDLYTFCVNLTQINEYKIRRLLDTFILNESNKIHKLAQINYTLFKGIAESNNNSLNFKQN